MKKLFIITLHLGAFVLLLTAPSQGIFAQSQYYHTAGIYLDNGLGGTITLVPPTTGTGGTITLPPAGLVWPTSNATGVLTNDGSGSLSWGSGGGVTPAYVNAFNVGFQAVPSFTNFALGTVSPSAVGFTGGPATFTATNTGIYLVDFSVAPNASSPASDIAVTVNGSAVTGGEFSAAATLPVHGTTILSLSAGDVVALRNVGGTVFLTSPSGSATTASLRLTRIQ